jgi:hypothetical protein
MISLHQSFVALSAIFFVTLSAAAYAPQQTAQTKTLTHLEGKTVSANGSPLADVLVHFNCHIYKRPGQAQRNLRWSAQSGEDGNFKVDVSDEKLPNNTAFFLSIEYSKDDYAGNKSTKWTDGAKTFDGKLPDITIKREIVATGTLAPPKGPETEPIENARLAIGMKVGNSWNFDDAMENMIHCDNEGSFEFSVPEDSNLFVLIQADNYPLCWRKISIPAMVDEEQVHDVGEISLNSGTKISGVVLDQDRVPRANAIVSISQQLKKIGNLKKTIVYAQTDVEGFFELPPRVGKCVVAVVASGVIDGEEIKSEGGLLPIKPMTFDFDENQESVEIELIESPVYKISGTANWADGNDQNKATPKIMFRLDGLHERNQEVTLDAEGNFEFEALEGLAGRIWVVGGNSPHDPGEDGNIEGRLTTESLKQNRGVWDPGADRIGNSFEFTGFERDVSNIEIDLFFKPFTKRSLGAALMNEIYYWLPLEDRDE